MRTLKLFAVLVAIAILAGCAGTAKRNANLYATARQADVEQTKAESLAESNATAARATAFAALAAKCAPADTACVVALSDKLVLSDAIAALKAAARPAQAQTPVPYERDLAAKSKDILTGVTPLGLGFINADVAKTQSDNSTRVQLGEQAMVSGIVAGATGSARDVAIAAVEHAQPNVTVGGDYVPGTQHIGDTVTGDGNATRGSQIGDTLTGDGNAAGGAQIGDNIDVDGVLVESSEGTQIETGEGDQFIEMGLGDQFSPESNDGNECTGEGCQPIEPPDPPPAPTPVVDPGT